MEKFEFVTKGAFEENCHHVVEYGYGSSLQFHLMWRLVNCCDVILTKELFSNYCNEFGNYILVEYELNKKGENFISHYNSVDMEAELLTSFLFLRFGDKVYCDKDLTQAE